MSKGRSRTMSICLSDLPKERMLKHENGKIYISLSTYDYDGPNQYGDDFSVSLPLTKEELQQKKNGADVKRIFCGHGKIWEDKGMQPVSEDDKDDLPF